MEKQSGTGELCRVQTVLIRLPHQYLCIRLKLGIPEAGFESGPHKVFFEGQRRERSMKLIIEMEVDDSYFTEDDARKFVEESKEATAINVEVGAINFRGGRTYTLSTEYFTARTDGEGSGD